MEEKKNSDSKAVNEETMEMDSEQAVPAEEETVKEAQETTTQPEDAEQETEKTEQKDSEEKTAEDCGAEPEDKKKKKMFNKKKKDPKDEQIEALNDKYQRLFAEFQNFRNRSEKEKSSMFEIGAKSIIEKILPVVDNFERGIGALSEEDLGSPVGQGMDLIYKQMAKALEEMGVEAIETEGKEFNPELHNAVMQVENDELEENMIARELQKGYTYKGSVIRHSMVAVTK